MYDIYVDYSNNELVKREYCGKNADTSHVSDVSHGETFFLGDKDWIIQAKWKWITNRIVITKKQ